MNQGYLYVWDLSTGRKLGASLCFKGMLRNLLTHFFHLAHPTCSLLIQVGQQMISIFICIIFVITLQLYNGLMVLGY